MRGLEPTHEPDIWGLALDRHVEGKLEFIHMEVRDGDCSLGPFPLALRPYAPDRVGRTEATVLEHLAGPVLDIGCGTGRHLRYLQRLGQTCTGIDVSPRCVEIARRFGASDARVCPVMSYTTSRGALGAAIVMGGSLGIGGSVEATRRMIEHVAPFIREDGKLVVSSSYDPDVRHGLRPKPEHPRTDELRFRFDQYVGPWTRFTAFEPDHAEELLRGLGWAPVALYWGDPLPEYFIIAVRAGRP